MDPSYPASATGHFLISAFPYGIPHDAAQWLALALAALVLLASPLVARPRPRAWFVAFSALAAAALSGAYVVVYLRGGPRIIDATTYFLEGRALSEGVFAWPLVSPETSTLGRFLVRADGAAGPTIAGIFPPGYPAALALGFWLGSPLLVGPALAAALVVATDSLARRVTRSLSGDTSAVVAQVAVLLSVVCAALRYHTADTMSHGLAALCFAASLALVFKALDSGSARAAMLGGLFAGWLVATRPVSGLALGLVLALVFALDRARSRKMHIPLLAAIALGAVPGALLLVLHQHAATGAWLTSSQSAYYAVSDGPSGCFTYGFGSPIGCVGEHGDFVRAQLRGGFGVFEASMTTLRRLKQHLIDAGNAEPLLLVVIAGAVVAARDRRARFVVMALGLQILVYVPFYFDGNYPGGGARFYADVLPLEHILMAIVAVGLARRGGALRHAGPALVAASLVGFAFRAGFDHAALRDREGGLPMYEPARTAGLASGSMVFFDTDHGLNLALDPGSSTGIRALREHGDALDRLVWEAAGRPPAYRYRFPIEADRQSEVSIEPYAVERVAMDTLAGVSLWPPREQHGAFALRHYTGHASAHSGRLLAFHRDGPGQSGRVVVALPASWLEGASIAVRVALAPNTAGRVIFADRGAALVSWPLDRDEAAPRGAFRCVDLPEFRVPRGLRDPTLRFEIDPTAPPSRPNPQDEHDEEPHEERRSVFALGLVGVSLR